MSSLTFLYSRLGSRCTSRRLNANRVANRSFLNIITEMIAGYAWPGNAIANMCVKMYGYNSVKHGMDFAQDLKLGQYMVGVPPSLPQERNIDSRKSRLGRYSSARYTLRSSLRRYRLEASRSWVI